MNRNLLSASILLHMSFFPAAALSQAAPAQPTFHIAAADNKTQGTYFIEADCGSPCKMTAREALSLYEKKMELGQLLYFNGNTSRAIKAFKSAASLKPDAFEPHLNLVNIHVQSNEYALAIAECREGLRVQPTHKDMHLILGNLLRTVAGKSDAAEQVGMFQEARKHLRIAEELGADPALVNSTLGVIAVQQGDFPEAMKLVTKAIDQKFQMPDAHLIKGILYHKNGENDAAIKELDLAIKQKGKNAEARNTRADMLYSQGKTDEALQEYKRALKDDPNYYQAMRGIANILISMKQWDESLKYLIKAQELDPEPKGKQEIEDIRRLNDPIELKLLTPGGLFSEPGRT